MKKTKFYKKLKAALNKKMIRAFTKLFQSSERHKEAQ